MFRTIEKHFARRSAGRKVVDAMLRYGYAVRADGSIYSGPVEMAPAKIGRALGVDRRVVIDTARQIAANEKLLGVFVHLQPRAYFGQAANSLGFDCIEMLGDPEAVGCIAQVTGVLAEHKVNLRQVIVDDPELYPDDPLVSMVVNGRLPMRALQALRRLPSTQKIVIR